MKPVIEEGMTCGFLCPRCKHCDAWIVAFMPIELVLFELECQACEYVWWQD